MHERVAAQDRVASRQRIRGDIGKTIFALIAPAAARARRRSISAGTMSTPTYRTPRLAALIQPASPQGASSNEVTPSFWSSRDNSARSTAVASSSEPSPEVDAAAPHKLVS